MPLPVMFLGENEVDASLFLFLSLSRRDVSSSSEDAESSSPGGAERTRLWEVCDLTVWRDGRRGSVERGGKDSDGDVPSWSHGTLLFLLDFGFE